MLVSPARAAAFEILLKVETEGAYGSELLHSPRLQKLSAADHGLSTELVMGVLRWRSSLDAEIARTSSQRLEKLDIEVLAALRLGTYQLAALERIPAHAAINESVELVKTARKRSAAPFVNAVLRKISQRGSELRENFGGAGASSSAAAIAAAFAHPAWLVERWYREFGPENTARICGYDQQVPVKAIRLCDPAAEDELRREHIRLAPGVLMANARLVLPGDALSGDVSRNKAIREGRITIQDEASQLVATLVGRGERLLDCCAAPGGKTSVLADRNPEASILAAELHPHRASLLRDLVKSTNVRVVAADAQHLPVGNSFDRVLADVPCSGTGTLARNPEIKWRLQPSDLNDLHARQVGILSSALKHLSPGGRIVYATCSMEREENEKVIEEVLQGNSSFRVMDSRLELEKLRVEGELVWKDVNSLTSGFFLRTIPGVHPCDGFFAAVIEKS
ncbi:MAG TPA: transcription antitermination factor NusB [Terriglobales bacterium]|nr:transcription antitermination factor NusB [Terriglobales bacterium]